MRTTQRSQSNQPHHGQAERNRAQHGQTQHGQTQHGQTQHGQTQDASSQRSAEQSRMRQASVTSAPMTPGERASLRAIASMYRASAPRSARARSGSEHPADPGRSRPGQHAASPAKAGPPTLRRTTGIVLTAAGAILWLGVHARVAFVATQPAGLVLLVAGLLWLWIPVPAKRERLQRRFDQLVSYLEWDPARDAQAKCSLDDLLEPRSDSAPDRPRE